MRKIAVVTGSRAEYGLLYWLMKELDQDPEIILQVVVTGMHLSPEFGLSYRLIEQDGFEVAAKIEMLLSSDTSVGVAKSVALGIIGCSDVFSRLNPDMIILLGDRFEALAVAQTALLQKIPVAHIHGGELSEGAVDDAIRHSITKMSHLHFVAADVYRQRVIQLGENPKTVFNVGAPGLERIAKTKLYTRAELEEKIQFKFGKLNFLVTYHPSTLESDIDSITLQNIFTALNYFSEANIIFTKANADEMGRSINTEIDEYVLSHSERAKAYVTLGDLNYLSLLPCVDVVIGNSSSGLIEVPYFCKPTINIGSRQKNRLRAKSVVDCSIEANDIINAIERVLTPEFQEQLKTTVSIYTQDQTAKKIKNIVKAADLKELIIKKFYDVPVNKAEIYAAC